MANTPFLDLVKPAGTDRALVSVINSNSDKIDTGVSTLSEQIGTLRTCENLGTISSQSDLETALNTVVSGMAVNSNKAIQINCTSSFSAFSGSTVYNAMVSKGGQSNNYATVLFQSINGTGNAIIKATKNQSWRFEQLALESEISSSAGGVPVRNALAVDPGKSFQVTLSNSFSSSEGFALVVINIGGNSAGGAAMLFLGRGTGKVKDLLGNMDANLYTASYSNGTWTITNNSPSASMFITVILSK